MPGFETRTCLKEHLHDPHYWGDPTRGGPPYHCTGYRHPYFYRDWEREVRRFHPPGPDQIQAAQRMLDALGSWAEVPDTAGSRWAMKFLTWLANYETPPPAVALPRNGR